MWVFEWVIEFFPLLFCVGLMEGFGGKVVAWLRSWPAMTTNGMVGGGASC
jgi:hypothetical protein